MARSAHREAVGYFEQALSALQHLPEHRSTREQATSQARDYVGRVSESTSTMLQRLEAMESELGTLITGTLFAACVIVPLMWFPEPVLM